MDELTLFSVIDDKKYEKYVIPFIYFPLATNINVKVEVAVKNYSEFIKENADAIDLLEMWFPKQFAIHPIESEYWNVIPCGSTARFYMKPQSFRTTYTKITDIDIMHIDKNIVNHFLSLDLHFPHLSESPYLALKRKDASKLSGTMCVRTMEFYTKEWEEHVAKYMEDVWEYSKFSQKLPPFDQPHYYYDEYVNWDLVVPVHGKPDKRNEGFSDDVIRPIQGVHISPNRPAYAPKWQPDFPDWGITEERKERMNEIRKTRQYQIISMMFTQEMRDLLDQI